MTPEERFEKFATSIARYMEDSQTPFMLVLRFISIATK